MKPKPQISSQPSATGARARTMGNQTKPKIARAAAAEGKHGQQILGWVAVCALSARRGRGFPPTGGREGGLGRHETFFTEPEVHSGRAQPRALHGTKKSPTAIHAAFSTHSTEPEAHSARAQPRAPHGTKKSPTNEPRGRNKGAFFATVRKRPCFV